VKQIPSSYRLKLAEAILLVNEWQDTGGSPALVRRAQEAMGGFGVTFVEEARPEAAAALALLLFGDPEVTMPGGYSNQELSAESPIKAIAAFPQELVLLGRATILIKGIAKRLDINWDLARKWRPMAEQALNCGVDGCLMPTWSAAPSTAPKAEALVDGPVRFYVEGSRAAHTSATRPPARPPPPAPDQARGLQPRPASANLAQMSWLAGHTGPVFQIGALPGGALRLQGVEQATAQVWAGEAGRARARTSQAPSGAAGGAHRLTLYSRPDA
jgi:hypothetical protein